KNNKRKLTDINSNKFTKTLMDMEKYSEWEELVNNSFMQIDMTRALVINNINTGVDALTDNYEDYTKKYSEEVDSFLEYIMDIRDVFLNYMCEVIVSQQKLGCEKDILSKMCEKADELIKNNANDECSVNDDSKTIFTCKVQSKKTKEYDEIINGIKKDIGYVPAKSSTSKKSSSAKKKEPAKSKSGDNQYNDKIDKLEKEKAEYETKINQMQPNIDKIENGDKKLESCRKDLEDRHDKITDNFSDEATKVKREVESSSFNGLDDFRIQLYLLQLQEIVNGSGRELEMLLAEGLTQFNELAETARITTIRSYLDVIEDIIDSIEGIEVTTGGLGDIGYDYQINIESIKDQIDAMRSRADENEIIQNDFIKDYNNTKNKLNKISEDLKKYEYAKRKKIDVKDYEKEKEYEKVVAETDKVKTLDEIKELIKKANSIKSYKDTKDYINKLNDNEAVLLEEIKRKEEQAKKEEEEKRKEALGRYSKYEEAIIYVSKIKDAETVESIETIKGEIAGSNSLDSFKDELIKLCDQLIDIFNGKIESSKDDLYKAGFDSIKNSDYDKAKKQFNEIITYKKSNDMYKFLDSRPSDSVF
nr:hypothetical protein [Lachnospiraceae bacterium]